MKRMSAAGIDVPEPYGVRYLYSRRHPFTSALVMSDLGDAERAVDHLKRLIQEGEDAQILRFETHLIEMTAGILAGGMLDMDHTLVNTLVPEHGRPVRIDFEVTRVTPGDPAQREACLAEMLGRFLSSYCYAVQPDAQRVVSFSDRLSKKIDPPRGVLRETKKYIDKKLREQGPVDGRTFEVPLEWS